MALGDVIATLAAQLILDTAAFEKGATLAEKRMEQNANKLQAIGSKMAGIGGKMSLAISAPLTALGVASYKAAQESADALGQVEAALKSMGNASGRTSEQLQALAGAQMSKSLYDDDEILRKVTANLLTFGKISGTAFDQAQQAAIDLSARLGTDLQSSAVLVGKALNDPIKGVSALTRVGVSFTEQQKEQIKAMAEAGNVAGAQAMILGELQKQYGGAAAAARAADPTAAQKQAWNDFQETIGKFVIDVLPPLTDFLAKVLQGFNNLSPGMQKAVVAGAALAVALGPVLTVFGGILSVGAPLIVQIPRIAAAFGLLGRALLLLAANPYVLGLAAVIGGIYLAWKNWDKITAIVKNLYTAVKTWVLDKLNAVWEGVKAKIDAVKGWFFGLYDAVVGHSYVPDMVDEIAAQMARLDKAMVQPAQAATSAATQAFQQMQQEVRGLLDQLFPEIAAKNTYGKQRAALISALGLEGSTQARLRLADQFDTSRPSNDNVQFDAPSTIADFSGVTERLGDLTDKLADRTGAATVRIAKSFKDMAEETMNKLNSLAEAIKGGGFLNILQSVIGLGLQLGSIGAFGKKIQTNINATKGYASGTMSAASGLHLVGERGPELVQFRGGERVYNNRQSMAMGGLKVEVVANNNGFGAIVRNYAGQVVAEAAPSIASAGGDVGLQRVRYAGSRRL